MADWWRDIYVFSPFELPDVPKLERQIQNLPREVFSASWRDNVLLRRDWMEAWLLTTTKTTTTTTVLMCILYIHVVHVNGYCHIIKINVFEQVIHPHVKYEQFFVFKYCWYLFNVWFEYKDKEGKTRKKPLCREADAVVWGHAQCKEGFTVL